MTFIERRKLRNCGSLETWYEIRAYAGRYESGNLRGRCYGGETIAMLKTKREALKYCKANNIVIEEGTP